MRTKKGDMVRICHDGPNGMQEGACLSRNRYKAVGASNDGALVVEGPFYTRYRIKSWVRCAEMKEGES